MDQQAAIRFISSYGNPSEQARLRYLTLRQPPTQMEREVLFYGQRRDGGWPPFWDPDYSSVDATCFRLAQAHQLGLEREDAEVARALRFLIERQSSRGSWEEDASAASTAPAWALPGELDALLYLTANCGYWLALLDADPAPARLAASFLVKYLDSSGRLPGFLHTNWLAAGLWTRLGQHTPAKKVFAFLSSRLPTLSASACAWMITALRQAGVPADLKLIQDALPILTESQAEDGRWSSEDGPARDVHATLEALTALRLAGVTGAKGRKW